ncbi:MAG: hypothetical protein ACPGLV_04635 [Bacteroidia bacterium]
MKNLVTSTIFLSLLPFLAISQNLADNYKITTYEEFKVKDLARMRIRFIENDFVYFSTGASSIYLGEAALTLYKKDLGDGKLKSLDVSPKNGIPLDLVNTDKDLYMVYRTSKGKNMTIWIDKVDKATLKFEKNPIELLTIEPEHGSIGRSFMKRKERLMVYYLEKEKQFRLSFSQTDKEGVSISKVLLFDDNFKLLSEKESAEVEKVENSRASFAYTTNNLEIIKVLTNFKEKRSSTADPNRVEINHYTKKGETPFIYTVNPEGKSYRVHSVSESKNKNELLITGIYKEIASEEMGFFKLIYPMEHEKEKNLKFKLSPIESTFLIDKFDANDYYHYNYFRKIDMKDNRYLLVGQQYFHQSYYSSLNNTTTNTFHYACIVVLAFDEEGNLTWKQKIPKYQKTYGSSDGASFYLEVDSVSGNLTFMFNDNIENQGKKKLEDLKNGLNTKNQATFIVRVDNEGNVTKDVLIEPSKDKYIPLFNNIRQLDDDLFLVFKQRKNNQVNYKFARIEKL